MAPKTKSLSHGRPPTLSRSPSILSSRTTRTLIRKHHQLQKRLSHALSTSNQTLAATLSTQLESTGGLPAYQAASLTGQSEARGGDTSKALLKFLEKRGFGSGFGGKWKREGPGARRWKMLDVGALSTNTAVARCGWFEVERIDLHSQEKGILEQDFMERPVPKGNGEEERFDIVGLSLVVNYVPDARVRGAMLRRICEFLRKPGGDVEGVGDEAVCEGDEAECERDEGRGGKGSKGAVEAEKQWENPFPALFLVLPAPCVTNSRYLNQERLEQIMQSLGYRLLDVKVSAKLVYYLWQWEVRAPQNNIPFLKKEIVAGQTRNNFAIILE